jgi:hypothetical protein
MQDDMRDELIRYFESDIGMPPVGARERVLSGLHGSARHQRHRSLEWLAVSAAMILMVLLAGALLVSRAVGRPQPAGAGMPPPARSGAAVAYDAARGELVVFGGVTAGGTALRDTWTWNGRAWAQHRPPASPPAVREGAVMAFDAANGTVVLSGDQGATWTWDGRTWSRHATAPSPGGAVSSAIPNAMAYDPASRTVLLYLALADGGHQLWSWNGASWSPIHPRTMPDIFGSAAMAWDGSRIVVIGTPRNLVGGQLVAETWAWDGSDWSQLSPAVRLPVAATSLAYDQAHRQLVAFIVTSDIQSSETWVWDGATWRKEHPRHQPAARGGPAVAYDLRAQRVVLYGGTDGRSTDLGDTWTWDGNDWTLVQEGGR